MTNTAIEFPMSEERLIEIYQDHFPGEPYDTEAGPSLHYGQGAGLERCVRLLSQPFVPSSKRRFSAVAR